MEEVPHDHPDVQVQEPSARGGGAPHHARARAAVPCPARAGAELLRLWSRRATLYGGDRSPGRDAALLDPARDAARVRAMYTNPRFTRRGVGRLILTLCED